MPGSSAECSYGQYVYPDAPVALGQDRPTQRTSKGEDLLFISVSETSARSFSIPW